MNNSAQTILIVAAIVILISLIVGGNIYLNDMKERNCLESGGVFIENTSDATLSSCYRIKEVGRFK